MRDYANAVFAKKLGVIAKDKFQENRRSRNKRDKQRRLTDEQASQAVSSNEVGATLQELADMLTSLF